MKVKKILAFASALAMIGASGMNVFAEENVVEVEEEAIQVEAATEAEVSSEVTTEATEEESADENNTSETETEASEEAVAASEENESSIECPSNVYVEAGPFSDSYDLKATHFYDVNQDGIKETVAFYSNKSGIGYYRVYDNDGSYKEYKHVAGADGAVEVALVYDKNINMYYIADIYNWSNASSYGFIIYDAENDGWVSSDDVDIISVGYIASREDTIGDFEHEYIANGRKGTLLDAVNYLKNMEFIDGKVEIPYYYLGKYLNDGENNSTGDNVSNSTATTVSNSPATGDSMNIPAAFGSAALVLGAFIVSSKKKRK